MFLLMLTTLTRGSSSVELKIRPTRNLFELTDRNAKMQQSDISGRSIAWLHLFANDEYVRRNSTLDNYEQYTFI